MWPVVSDPAMKKMVNSSISLSLLRGWPLLSRSLIRCPGSGQAALWAHHESSYQVLFRCRPLAFQSHLHSRRVHHVQGSETPQSADLYTVLMRRPGYIPDFGGILPEAKVTQDCALTLIRGSLVK